MNICEECGKSMYFYLLIGNKIICQACFLESLGEAGEEAKDCAKKTKESLKKIRLNH